MSQQIILNEERNVNLTPMLLKCGGEFGHLPKRPLVLVLPGGGYSMCSDREAEPVALAYNNAGYHAAILRYSVDKFKAWPNPLDDYEQAMQYIYDHADEWHVDATKIAVIGFSAGGHLASCAATIAKHKPQAVILGYPVTIQEHIQSLGGIPGTSDKVNDETPPVFIFATRNDSLVAVQNTIDFVKALDTNMQDFECHIYSYGAHGFSTGTYEQIGNGDGYTPRVKNWVSDSIGWLDEIFNKKLISIKQSAKYLDAHAEYLSSYNTLGALLSSPEAVEVLSKAMPMLSGPQKDARASIGMVMSLRDLMRFARMPASGLDAIDEALKTIKNPNKK